MAPDAEKKEKEKKEKGEKKKEEKTAWGRVLQAERNNHGQHSSLAVHRDVHRSPHLVDRSRNP